MNMKSKKLSYRDVSDYVLAYSNDVGELITNLKLQKLVYYAQAWYLANKGEELFPDDFQAWVHGPAIPALYGQYKKFGSTPILCNLDIKNVSSRFSDDLLQFMKELLGVYLPYGAYQLELMTHSEDPWIKARNGYEKDQSCSVIILKDDMKEYYGKKKEQD